MNLIAIAEQDFLSLKSDIQEIKEALSRKAPSADDLITEEVLLEKLGNPHPSTIWRKEKKGILKPIKIGSKKMYRISDLVALQANALFKRTYKKSN